MNMTVMYRVGPGLIIGHYPYAGKQLSFGDPWGNWQENMTGSKTEYGAGGFEFVAPHAGQGYRIVIGDDSFSFDHGGTVTELFFSTTGTVEPIEVIVEEEDEPLPDWLEEIADPEVEPEEDLVDLFTQILDRLDQILALLESGCDGNCSCG